MLAQYRKVIEIRKAATSEVQQKCKIGWKLYTVYKKKDKTQFRRQRLSTLRRDSKNPSFCLVKNLL